MFQVKKFDIKYTISLKLVLVVMLLLVGMIPMLIQSQILIGTFRQNLIDTKMKEIKNHATILSNKMSRTGYMVTEPRDTLLDNEIALKADIFNGRILVVNRDYKIIRDTFSLSEGKMNISEEVIKCFQGENSNKYNKDKHYSALTVPVYDNTNKKIAGVMVVTASTENLLADAGSMAEKGSLMQMMAFWSLLVLVLVLVKVVMRPFKELQKVLNCVAEGNLDEDIRSHIYKETEEISESVSKTIMKLKAVDQSREEFVSNVSHELKTPITSIRVLADSLMGMEEAPVELYREFMADISDEIDRESKIIDDLLTLVRMDKTAGSELINIAQVNINDLLELILKRLRPIAKRRNIELIFESIREVTADIDEVKLSLALSNLVENAVKYNIESGWVKVTLDADHKFFYVKVADSGIGIPEEFQEHVFERFYRVDKARSRETGGTGLGLAITRNIILMHQGAIKLQSKEGEGTTFTVRVPLTYIS